ncbi:MAG: DUF1801 domain-containing protein [Chitinophagaceae bacterium]|nr:DUF1801 domain-containing protein [Chitinophagaceae bacterium]
MAKTKLNDKEQIDEHISKLSPELAETVETIRNIILKTDKQIGERIKWNNPSFYFTGPMKPFDPKEYKSDIAVFNLHKGRIMLVLPSGAKVKNGATILEGDYKDGRRTITFKDGADVKLKKNDLQEIIKDWIRQVE